MHTAKVQLFFKMGRDLILFPHIQLVIELNLDSAMVATDNVSQIANRSHG
jgi:hypothetical protein